MCLAFFTHRVDLRSMKRNQMILSEPNDLLEKLEFDKVIELLKASCFGVLGQDAFDQLPIETERAPIVQKLEEVVEYKLTIEENDPFPMSAYEPIDQELKMLSVIDFVLPEEGLQKINQILRNTQRIFQFFTHNRQEVYPRLYAIIRPISFEEALLEAIEQVIDEEGNIKPNASPALLKISKAIASKQKEMDRVFRQIINLYRPKGWLTDNVESFRNGRRVLSVPAEHKRKIRGIIHDESTTGKTAFIEPEAVIDINNDIFDLVTEQKKEIYRILKELSATLRPFISAIAVYQELLTTFDVIQAKGHLAVQMRGNQPKVLDKPHLGIEMGYHPLLYLKNKSLGRETIPFDLKLFGPNRILVLSGPNAGGKSVTMKSVGLMQLMLQAGMLIPVDEISEMGIFQEIFADIGDQQSLEDDLSTYSSRLRNMRIFLEKATDQSLILIDEFGSGTDPKIGGSIAEAILNELNQREVFGVITTHYSNLKIYAFKTKGLVNGSMLFDKEELAPTYHLKVGRPGSSYAFEIAQKSGLSQKVLNYARHRSGKNEKAVDQLLVDLQVEKKELEEKLIAIRSREQQLDKLVQNYEMLHKDLEYRRKKVKLDAKEQALQMTARDNKDLEKLIRELKEEKNLEKAKAKAQKVREERKKLVEEVQGLREEIYHPVVVEKAKEGPLEVGDFVKMRMGGATGEIESISKKSAVVKMGMMRMTVPLRDLQHAKEPLEVRNNRSVKTEVLDNAAKFESKIDIRGMRLEEAYQVIEEFIDRALMANAIHLEIVHGKGNGVLRKAVRAKLREYQAVKEVNHPAAKQGGDGVTLVEMG